MNPLVSIITPCYNGETFLERYFDSILKQTYRPIELIFVNDGSTDQTEQIVNLYQKKFKENGICFRYVFQENKGQAAAVNQGLKIYQGDYITWPDSDDFLASDAIEKKVAFLEEHKEVASVFSKVGMVEEDDLLTPIKVLSETEYEHKALFEKYLNETATIFLGYVIRSSEFLKINPERHIYESRAGQNWQLILPILYHFPCGYMDELLYYYVKREGSHSSRRKSLQGILDKVNGHEDVLLHVVREMKISEEDNYVSSIKKRYEALRIHINEKYKDGVK